LKSSTAPERLVQGEYIDRSSINDYQR